MEEETKKEFEAMTKMFQVMNNNNIEVFKILDQHADIINGNKDRSQKSVEDIEKQIKAIQTDLDKTIDLIHDLKSLPNILEALKNVEKSKTS